MNYIPSSLPEIDQVEIVNLFRIFADNVSEYMQNSADAESVVITGKSAQQLADLWRKLSNGGGSRCHNPPFGLRFYVGKNVILQASICWQCDNIFGDEKGIDFLYNFDSSHKVSQELLTVCKSFFSDDEQNT